MTDISTLVSPPTPTEPEVLTPATAKQKLGGLEVNRVENRTPYMNMMIYGNSGVGKTRLCGSAVEVEELAPVLFVDIEGGLLTLESCYPQVEYVRVMTWQKLQDVYNELYRNPGRYKTIVLDSLTEIQKFSMDGIMKEVVQKDSDRDPDVPSIREWGNNGEQTRKFVRGFRDLPCNTIFTALAVHDKDSRTGMIMTTPSLSGKLKQEVAGFLDIVAYYYMKKVGDKMQRLLLTQATEQQVAKDRSDRLPPVVEEPTMLQLYQLITGNEATPTTNK